MLSLFLPLFLVLLLVGAPVFFAMLAAPGLMIYACDADPACRVASRCGWCSSARR